MTSPMSEQECNDVIDSMTNAPFSPQSADEISRVWSGLRIDERNGFVSQCGLHLRSTDSCSVLRLKIALMAQNPIAAQNAMTRIGCVPGRDTSLTGDPPACNLDEKLATFATDYNWNPAWEQRYQTPKSLYAAKLSFVSQVQTAVSSTIATCNSCPELEMAMSRNYGFFPSLQAQTQSGMSLYTRATLFNQFVVSHCLAAVIRGSSHPPQAKDSVTFSATEYHATADDISAVITVVRASPGAGSGGIIPASSGGAVDTGTGSDVPTGSGSVASAPASPPMNVGSVHYKTVDGTAYDGMDYTQTSGTLVFRRGESVKTFTVKLKKHTTLQGYKYIYLVLDSSTGDAVIGTGGNTAVLYIIGAGVQ